MGIRDSFWHDIYVVLSDFSKAGDEATFQIHINPTVKVVWMSVFLLVLGGLLSLMDRLRGRHSRDFMRLDRRLEPSARQAEPSARQVEPSARQVEPSARHLERSREV